jgi:hypothetical protein
MQTMKSSQRVGWRICTIPCVFERVDLTLDGETGKAEVKRFCDAVCQLIPTRSNSNPFKWWNNPPQNIRGGGV